MCFLRTIYITFCSEFSECLLESWELSEVVGRISVAPSDIMDHCVKFRSERKAGNRVQKGSLS